MSLLRRPGPAPGPQGRLVGVAPDGADWRFIRFAAHRLAAGATLRGDSGPDETALIVLGGRCGARAGTEDFGRVGTRRDVWDKVPPAVLLLPPGTPYAVEAETELHLVLAGARAEGGGAPRLIAPEQMVTEHRGAGLRDPVTRPLTPSET